MVSIAIFALLVGAYYLLIGRRRTARETAALMAGTIAVLPMLDGGVLLIEEIARQQRGRSTSGIVVGKLAGPWMGEPGVDSARGRTSPGRGADAASRYSLEPYGGIVRLLETGSPDAWIVEYRYSCGRAARCWQREAVSHTLWSALRVGETVAVRAIIGRETSGRLEANPSWRPALARLAIGGTLFALATWASGALTRRRETLIAVPAVVTSVQPVDAAGAMHWRVGFAYLCAGGITHERVDEVYVAGLEPGQECTAVYPRGRPHLGTLRLPARDTAARA
jgi:hypothetical protein